MLKYRKNVNTQFGEDGIVEYLSNKLGIQDGGFVCEFGAWDGIHLSNTFRLVKERSFKALYIEADPVRYNDLLKTCETYPTIQPVCDRVLDNLDKIFEINNFPYDIDILSIDVDSVDYEIWKNTHKVNAKIVIIEPDPSIPSWINECIYPTKNGMANKKILVELGTSKGYTLVCDTTNLFFVRNDLMTDDIEIDDRMFPWHLSSDFKNLVIFLARTNIPKDELYKYVQGAQLGFMDEKCIN